MTTTTIPYLTTPQMVEVDRAMIEDYRIELIQMMENAGRNLAHLCRTRFLEGDPQGRSVAVLAGPGGNGGGALVCARRLHNWGAKVEVWLTGNDESMTPVPRHQLDILRRMNVSIPDLASLPTASTPDVIIDGIIGYSLKGAPRGTFASLIRWANSQPAPILSLDVPSGIDASSGTVHEPSITAAATMTLALPKHGLHQEQVAAQIGELYLADISVPPGLYAEPALGIEVGAIFAREDILRIR